MGTFIYYATKNELATMKENERNISLCYLLLVLRPFSGLQEAVL